LTTSLFSKSRFHWIHITYCSKINKTNAQKTPVVWWNGYIPY
jgi:hypothetical protein